MVPRVLLSRVTLRSVSKLPPFDHTPAADAKSTCGPELTETLGSAP
jgi:hypothetical protein